ncbi:hypothetical protein CC2G_014522 [Coprinopsis cinerea AmutBmut pab1-1]|nr:hypothetical protein CC2G_014522 [Coprinopsis cinerea AmutBmut pab1-1]
MSSNPSGPPNGSQRPSPPPSKVASTVLNLQDICSSIVYHLQQEEPAERWERVERRRRNGTVERVKVRVAMEAKERIKLRTRSLMAVCLVTWALQEVTLDYLWETIPSLGILLRTISSVGPVVSCGTAMLVLSGELTAGSLQRFTALAKRVCSIDLGQERNIISPVLLLELVQHFGHSMPSLFPRLKTIKLKSLNEMANAALHFLAPVSTRSISIEAQVLPMDADPFVFPVFLKLGRMKSFKQLDVNEPDGMANKFLIPWGYLQFVDKGADDLLS